MLVWCLCKVSHATTKMLCNFCKYFDSTKRLNRQKTPEKPGVFWQFFLRLPKNTRFFWCFLAVFFFRLPKNTKFFWCFLASFGSKSAKKHQILTSIFFVKFQYEVNGATLRYCQYCLRLHESDIFAIYVQIYLRESSQHCGGITESLNCFEQECEVQFINYKLLLNWTQYQNCGNPLH